MSLRGSFAAISSKSEVGLDSPGCGGALGFVPRNGTVAVPYWGLCAAFGGRNAGLRSQARAASNRRRRLLASVDGVPYGAKNNPVGTPLPGCPHDSGRFLGYPGTGVPPPLHAILMYHITTKRTTDRLPRQLEQIGSTHCVEKRCSRSCTVWIYSF